MMNIEQARELQQSLMWGGVVEELDKKIFHIMQKLKTCTPEELKNLQFEINCYENLKRLPTDVIEREE